MARDGSGTARRAVAAFFDDRAAAQQAVDDLVAAKVGRDRITLVEGGAAPAAGEPVPTHDKGIWDTVKELFMADEDRHAYGEGLRRGGFLLSVMLGSGDAARVVEILDREGAIDMDARQADWELEGWDPARASADLRGLSEAEVRAGVEPVGAVGPAFGTDGVAPAPAVDPASLSDADVRAAVEPVGAVGPAFGTDGAAAPAGASTLSSAEVRAALEPAGAVGPAFAKQAPAGPGPRRTVVRDTEADGLRLRSYVESHDSSDAAR